MFSIGEGFMIGIGLHTLSYFFEKLDLLLRRLRSLHRLTQRGTSEQIRDDCMAGDAGGFALAGLKLCRSLKPQIDPVIQILSRRFSIPAGLSIRYNLCHRF